MKRFLLVFIAAAFLVATGCRQHHSPSPSQSVLNKDDVLFYMNSYRNHPLKRHPQLDMAAQHHAEWMAVNKSMSHRQGFLGSLPADRVSNVGYKWSGVAENVAQGQRSEKEVVVAWYNSSGHRANMQGNYRHTGVGIAYGPDGLIYWVTVFANPL